MEYVIQDEAGFHLSTEPDMAVRIVHDPKYREMVERFPNFVQDQAAMMAVMSVLEKLEVCLNSDLSIEDQLLAIRSLTTLFSKVQPLDFASILILGQRWLRGLGL